MPRLFDPRCCFCNYLELAYYLFWQSGTGFHRPPRRVLGRDHTFTIPSLPLPQPKLQSGRAQFPLAPNYGKRCIQTGHIASKCDSKQTCCNLTKDDFTLMLGPKTRQHHQSTGAQGVDRKCRHVVLLVISAPKSESCSRMIARVFHGCQRKPSLKLT